VGYDTISDILNANLALKVLIVVMLAKAVALVVSLGSGTSGGYLGRPGIMAARLRRLDEEHVREPGWVKKLS